jgi:putative transposase
MPIKEIGCKHGFSDASFYNEVYRIYTAEGLSINKRKKTKRMGVRVPLVAALAVNQTGSMNFVSDTIACPGAISWRIKWLTVTDDFSHEYVNIKADFGIGGAYVTGLLACIFHTGPLGDANWH